MPLDKRTPSQRLHDMKVHRPFGTNVTTPNGTVHIVVGPALHSETLELLLVIFSPKSKSWLAVAPAAVEAIEAEFEPPADIDQMLDGKVFRHKKGGVYTRLARVRARDGDMTLYASHADGSFWLRPTSMFEDGRFEPADQVRLATAELDLV